MRILITGATGFIAADMVATLKEAGHDIICCVKNTKQATHRFWYATIISCDFNQDTAADIWLARLQTHQIDAVINCVGVLQKSRKQSIEAIHRDTPIALFSACQQANVKRVIQISALGAGETDTTYSKTKHQADEYLLDLKDISRLVVRPSVVVSTGAYGGTALFRALSALPFVIPIVGQGQQLMSPIFLHDLSRAILHYIAHPEISGKIIYAVGNEQITQKTMFIKLRAWLGFTKAVCVSVPLGIISLAAKLGDWFTKSPINTTTFTLLAHNNIHDPKPFFETIPFKVSSFTESLISHPSSTQDRWHARLYFLRPCLRLSLAFLWLISGLIPLINISQANLMLAQIGIPTDLLDIFRIALSGLDIFIGFGILTRWRIAFVGILQFLVVFIYTVTAIFTLPSAWFNPLGPLVKNIPILVSILMWVAIEDDR